MAQDDKVPNFEQSLILQEYQSLREEILSRLNKISRLQEGLLLGTLIYITAILQKSTQGPNPTTFLFCIFLLVLPFITFIIELICTSEQDAVFRAGIYIRDNIEKQYRSSIFRGWEDWLERLDRVQRRRTSDNLIRIARRFTIIPLYCLASSVMGIMGLKEYFSLNFGALTVCTTILFVFCVYLSIFIVMIKKINVAQVQELSTPYYNVIVMDIDGCLMGSDRKISDLNKDAINSLQKKGVYIVLATGRNSASLAEVCTEINHSGYHVACHGSCIYNAVNNQEIQCQTISSSNMSLLIKQLNIYGFKWVAFSESNYYCKACDVEEIKFNLLNRRDISETKIDSVIGINDVLCYDWSNKIYKILIYISAKDNAIINELTKALNNSFKVIKSTPETLEVLDKKTSKAEAVEKILREIYGLNDIRSLVVGDYDSDIEMLSWGDQAVAPSNSSIKVRKLDGVDVLDISNDDNLIWSIAKIYFDNRKQISADTHSHT